MSEWYNIAAESEGTFIPFILATLIDVLRNDNVRLFHLARELTKSPQETIEDRSCTKVKSMTIRRAIPYEKPRSISLDGSYASLPGGAAESQGNLRGARSEVFLQLPYERRQRKTSEGALSPKERNGFIKEISGQFEGFLCRIIDPAALGSRRSIKSIGSLESISEEHQNGNSQVSLLNSEAEEIGLYNEVTDSVMHYINSSDDMTLLAELQNVIQHLKIHSQFHRWAGILEGAMNRSQSNSATPGEDKKARSVFYGSKSEERLFKKQTENMSHELEVKDSTPMQRKDISVIIDRTLLTNKQKDIFVFNKLANKLGVGTVISMDVAKKKPREIMKIMLRTWEQNKEFTTTAEELLAA